ncbi:hypothetical protein GQ457_07G039410 [Hibiscus cannabinus]
MTTVHPMDEERSTKKPKSPEFPQGIEIVDLESDSFCFTPIKDKGNNKTNAISVEQYSEERELRLATKITNFIDLANYDDDLFVLDFEPPKTPFSKKREKEKKPFSDHSITEPGESSRSKANRDPSKTFHAFDDDGGEAVKESECPSLGDFFVHSARFLGMLRLNAGNFKSCIKMRGREKTLC